MYFSASSDTLPSHARNVSLVNDCISTSTTSVIILKQIQGGCMNLQVIESASNGFWQ